jgi:threonine synthase
MLKIQCNNCYLPYPAEGTPYHCPRCGGLFDLVEPLVYDPAQLEAGLPGIWRYRHAFGLPETAPVISLGEGSTPLVWGQAGEMRVAFKCEFLNPSGSFKDRGSPLLVSFLRSRGVDTAVEDSSGNAGASFAAYAARARLKAKVFVPDSASGPKRKQIEAYGAELVSIMGPRSNAAEAVKRAAEEGVVYASHAYLPFNLPGYATTAFEIAGQLGVGPGTVLVPVGQGGLFLGLARGFEALVQAKVINKMPLLVGVQAMTCAPLWALFSYGAAGLSWVVEGQTVAEGIRVSHPLRGDAVLRTLQTHQGMLLAVDEAEILPGLEALARQGFYVEPTSAVIWNALAQFSGKVPEPVVAILTGSGLKWAGS